MDVQLKQIDNDRKITRENDAEFLYQYQLAVLLTLRDTDVLNDMQYRRAAERLSAQYRGIRR